MYVDGGAHTLGIERLCIIVIVNSPEPWKRLKAADDTVGVAVFRDGQEEVVETRLVNFEYFRRMLDDTGRTRQYIGTCRWRQG